MARWQGFGFINLVNPKAVDLEDSFTGWFHCANLGLCGEEGVMELNLPL